MDRNLFHDDDCGGGGGNLNSDPAALEARFRLTPRCRGGSPS